MASNPQQPSNGPFPSHTLFYEDVTWISPFTDAEPHPDGEPPFEFVKELFGPDYRQSLGALSIALGASEPWERTHLLFDALTTSGASTLEYATRLVPLRTLVLCCMEDLVGKPISLEVLEHVCRAFPTQLRYRFYGLRYSTSPPDLHVLIIELLALSLALGPRLLGREKKCPFQYLRSFSPTEEDVSNLPIRRPPKLADPHNSQPTTVRHVPDAWPQCLNPCPEQ
jgi:hypothetical protein